MEHLSKLLGSPARVKLLRLFAFNPERVFDRDTIIQLARVTPETASKELAAIARFSFITRKPFFKEVVRPGSTVVKKRKTIGWMVNQKFPHLRAFTIFMKESLSVSDVEIQKRFRGMGGIKLLVLSGSFIGEREGVLDILIAGDHMKEHLIKNAISLLEAESGKEMRYMILSTDEYLYRRHVRDKFIREVMDFTHKEIVNRVGKI
jgi:hypothetical protein